MSHASVFDKFTPTPVSANGYCIYDFLGIATDVRFKREWAKFAPPRGSEYTPPLPQVNEHYFDWVLTLESVVRASGTYRMIELGAGWGTWASVAAAAAKQQPNIGSVEIVAIEADQTRFDWMRRHFATNNVGSETTHLMHGAVAAEPGTVRFPVLDDPSIGYRTSLYEVHSQRPFVEVPAYTIDALISKLSGPVDFLHIDIQGTEYDILPKAMETLNKNVKAIMIGTHFSLEKHNEIAELFSKMEWREVMHYPRNALCKTPYGEVQFGDGLLAIENPRFISQ